MNAFRFLGRSFVFLTLITLLCVFLFPNLQRFVLANPFMNGVILFIFLFGVFYVFWKLFKIARETRFLQTFCTHFPHVSHTLQAQMENVQLLQGLLKALEDHKVIASSHGSMIVEKVQERLEENRDITRYLMALLIFMGLLGTFWGLSQTIASISQVISNLPTANASSPEFFEALKNSLKSPLGGMGTAFSTSFFGLSGSLVLGFLDLQLGRASQFFVRYVEEEITRFSPALLSAHNVSAEAPTEAYLQAFWQYLGEHMEGLQRTVAQNQEIAQLTQQSLIVLAEKLSKLTDQMRTEQTLMVKIGEAQIHLQHTFKEMTQGIITHGVPLDENTRAHLRNIDLLCEKLLKELGKQHKELLTDVRQEMRLLTQTISNSIAFKHV